MDVELPHTFGPADVQTFAALSGDDNPIHLDSDYASKQVKRRAGGGREGWLDRYWRESSLPQSLRKIGEGKKNSAL